MCRNVRHITLLSLTLFLIALNFGCGGGLPRASQSNQSPQTEVATSHVMEAPILGFAYSAGGSEVRAINGIPGASTQGVSFPLPEGVTRIEFASGQNTAIAVRTGGLPIGVISFAGNQPGPLVPITGAVSQPDIIAFSPNGAFAAVVSTAEGRLQVVAGLPNTPQLIRDIATNDMPDTAGALAIADDGLTLLEGTAHNAVYLLAGSGPQLIANLSELGGLVFTPKSNDALVFDRGVGTLAILQKVSTSRTTQQLASGLTGMEGTSDLVTDGHSAVITSANATHVWKVNLRSLQAQDLKLTTPATMLKPLRASGDYLLAWQPGQLAWIVDTNQANGAVYFVPAKATVQSVQAR